MDRKKKRIGIILIIALAAVIILIALLLRTCSARGDDWDDSQSQEDLGEIVYEGKHYRYNIDLTNILFMGIDSESGIDIGNTPGEAGQADCIMIVTLDKSTKKATVIQIPRDTMTEVDIYNSAGHKTGTVSSQIATQYGYCIGGKSSCFAVKQTLTELLYELPIDAYLAMDYAGIAPFNDAVGGVPIDMSEDYTRVDPAFKKGAKVTLTGDQAHKFVRWRDTGQDFSNNDRMRRQTEYLPAFIGQLRAVRKEKKDFEKQLTSLAKKYMQTDITAEEAEAFSEYELDMSRVQYLPGESAKGEIYEEFHVDETELQKMLIEKFYIPVD